MMGLTSHTQGRSFFLTPVVFATDSASRVETMSPQELNPLGGFSFRAAA